MFYANIWDPILIISQMAIMQATFYITLGISLYFFHIIFGSDLSLASILSPAALNVRHTYGWPPIVAHGAVVPVCAFALVHVVSRAKKCLDFTSTIYLFHFIVTLCYDGFPGNWEWWMIHMICLICIVVLAEFLCMKREMETIPRTAEETEEQTAMIPATPSYETRQVTPRDRTAETPSATPIRPAVSQLMTITGNKRSTSGAQIVRTTSREIPMRPIRSMDHHVTIHDDEHVSTPILESDHKNMGMGMASRLGLKGAPV